MTRTSTTTIPAIGTRCRAILPDGEELTGALVATPEGAGHAISDRGAEVWVHFDGRMSPVPFAVAQLEWLPTDRRLPSHPIFDVYRTVYQHEMQEAVENDDTEPWRAAEFHAAYAVERQFNVRLGRETTYAILTAPDIAAEPGRMGDALRLIARAFDAVQVA